MQPVSSRLALHLAAKQGEIAKKLPAALPGVLRKAWAMGGLVVSGSSPCCSQHLHPLCCETKGPVGPGCPYSSGCPRPAGRWLVAHQRRAWLPQGHRGAGCAELNPARSRRGGDRCRTPRLSSAPWACRGHRSTQAGVCGGGSGSATHVLVFWVYWGFCTIC